jgi:Flp pilus assembly protein TadD
MSLLLEALKRAEKAKEDAQRRAREGGGESASELRLEGEAQAGEAKRVVTRDELPPITGPLDIQSEDLRAEPTAASGLSLQEAAAPPPPPRRAAPEEPPAAQRAAARKVFEAKVREPNPRLPFLITIGALGAFAVGTVIYFYIQLSPPPPLYNTNPQPQAGEVAVAPPPPSPATAPAAGTGSSSVAGIQGLPPGPQAAREPAAPAPAPKPAPQPPRTAPPAEAKPAVRPAPAPRASAPRPRAAAAPAPAAVRAQPRVHPLVAAGYAAYQAGDMERARASYQAALADEPANRDALLGLAAVETRAQRFEAAAALYRRLLVADPRDAHAQAALLALRAPQTDPVSTESRLKALLATGPEEGVLYFTLGNQYAQQSRWPEAQQAYARAAALEPENPDYLYNLAVSHEHLRRPEAALGLYRRALILGLERPASFDPSAAQARVQALSR